MTFDVIVCRAMMKARTKENVKWVWPLRLIRELRTLLELLDFLRISLIDPALVMSVNSWLDTHYPCWRHKSGLNAELSTLYWFSFQSIVLVTPCLDCLSLTPGPSPWQPTNENESCGSQSCAPGSYPQARPWVHPLYLPFYIHYYWRKNIKYHKQQQLYKSGLLFFVFFSLSPSSKLQAHVSVGKVGERRPWHWLLLPRPSQSHVSFPVRTGPAPAPTSARSAAEWKSSSSRSASLAWPAPATESESGAKREETWPLTPAYHKPAWKEQTNERPGVRSSFSTFLLATCYRVLYNKALLMVTDLEADAGIWAATTSSQPPDARNHYTTLSPKPWNLLIKIWPNASSVLLLNNIRMGSFGIISFSSSTLDPVCISFKEDNNHCSQ